jgi:hypothetical protein
MAATDVSRCFAAFEKNIQLKTLKILLQNLDFFVITVCTRAQNECMLAKKKYRLEFSPSRTLKPIKIHRHICHTTIKLVRNSNVGCHYVVYLSKFPLRLLE